MDTQNVQAALDAAANQILAVVAPVTARLTRAVVQIAEADTASTDGVVITLPPTFEGVNLRQDAPVALGLLAHESGHFLQPLAEMAEAEQETEAPHWLGNVVLDIQGEALLASLFPPFLSPLTVVRRLVKCHRLAEYLAELQAGDAFPQVACAAALAGRFWEPEQPFSEDWLHRGPVWLPQKPW